MLQLPAHHHLAVGINACTWKTDLAMSRPIVVIDCRTWLLRIVGAFAAPASMAPACRRRSRPHHNEAAFARAASSVQLNSNGLRSGHAADGRATY